ncbi:GlsB/YeaQ/YmgE family stress response membrane protein [Vulgatibacter sp.]|uniref:GlsB/YeaQ/YmgE family stress response membrane protein n=1 Tax=Vulgatibacter sp. TaxID=1971226 RepID=UPI003562E928
MDEYRGLCGWICFGFFSGLFARAILPGDQNMGIIATTILGVAGAFVGGSIASLLGGGAAFELRPAGFVGAILGAVLILFAGELLFRRSKRRR